MILLVAKDILQKVSYYFGSENLQIIKSKIEEFTGEFGRVYRDKPSNRIIRCIIHLASGDVNKMEQLFQVALKDWRDVILWAEYDEHGNRVFYGHQRFTFK